MVLVLILGKSFVNVCMVVDLLVLWLLKIRMLFRSGFMVVMSRVFFMFFCVMMVENGNGLDMGLFVLSVNEG